MIQPRVRRTLLLGLGLLWLLDASGWSVRAQDQPAAPVSRSTPAPRLAPTDHPPLPGHPSLYWLLPDVRAMRTTGVPGEAIARFTRGVGYVTESQYALALPLVSNANLSAGPLASYARYYTAAALLGLSRLDEANASLSELVAEPLEGYLTEAVPLLRADVAIARGTYATALAILESLNDRKLAAPEAMWLKLARAAELAGLTDKALNGYRTVYYDFPLSAEAADAQVGIARLETVSLVPPDRFKRELTRAERLFAARRWAQARAGFEPLANAATTMDDRELIALRLAECDYFLERAAAAREALRPYLTDASRKAEARFFYLTATRAAGEQDTYVSLSRALIIEFPDSSWAEETLNNLATYYLQQNDDQGANAVFRDLLARFPKGRYAERAAWKSGWWAYKNGQFADAAQTFETAAAAYPRADMRPAWLYWSGRARDQIGDTITANSRYRLATADYLNSYYGRLSSRVLLERREAPAEPSVTANISQRPAPVIPTDALIRQLVGAELYADALRELQYARRVWGDTPAVEATIAWIRHQQGLDQKSWDRFQNLRGAINQMKHAYPQYLAAGGESLPPEVLRVMFPLDFWPLIRKYSEFNGLDPYLMAALIAQESTFTADVRSPANAVGLMQLLPSAGRQYARKVGLRYSSSLLTQPDANIRMGMAYFKDLSNRFGGDHFALASYNAGPQRVARWQAERPAIAQDEFIDDIPFPETQNYVKRIIGTAEDYRRLYGGGLLQPIARGSVAAAAASTPTGASPTAAKAPAKKAPAKSTPKRPRRTTRSR